jgi:hypothetical protein
MRRVRYFRDEDDSALKPGASDTDQKAGVDECIGVLGGSLETRAEDDEDVSD